MNSAQAYRVKSAFFGALIVSVILGAAGAIDAILRGPTDFLEQFVLTCLIMAAASACGLACASLAVRHNRPLPLVGIVLALAAAALQTVGVWADEPAVEYWQTTWCVSIFAVACGHVAALSLARLAPRHMWSLLLAYTLVFGVACLLALRILDYPWTPWIDQLLAIMMILDVAVTILIPYYHWRSRDVVARDVFARDCGGLDGESDSREPAKKTRDPGSSLETRMRATAR